MSQMAAVVRHFVGNEYYRLSLRVSCPAIQTVRAAKNSQSHVTVCFLLAGRETTLIAHKTAPTFGLTNDEHCDIILSEALILDQAL